ncbi:MAG: IS200/IS605 family element transposase accessory protein TnpB [Thaumarchaeota archaeon]|nr:IS200/IS605 family element transposase accessory protein TnpB [Nitrososphaerota archaeon]
MNDLLHLTYRFRLDPTKQQERVLRDTLETCRRLYNNLLDERINSGIGFYEQKRELTKRRKEDKYLKVVHSQVLQNVVMRLDESFQRFFTGLARFPKFRRQGKYSSFTYPQLGGFKVNGNRLKLSMIGDMKIRLHRPIDGSMKTCTIIRDIDQWYACITVKTEDDAAAIPSSPINSEKPAVVGVDVGVSCLAALSDGMMLPNPRRLNKSVERIRRLQRELSRKKNGSNNRVRAKMRLEKAWRQVRRQRDDTAHKASRYLVDNYGTIVFEDLRIKNMVKNHRLASAILDATWSKLRRLTAYKAERRGNGRVVLVEPRGTSQECSGCHRTVEKSLSVRTHVCPHCGLMLDRDVNAARNILARGLEQAHAETEPIPIIRIGKFSQGSRKPTALRRR